MIRHEACLRKAGERRWISRADGPFVAARADEGKGRGGSVDERDCAERRAAEMVSRMKKVKWGEFVKRYQGGAGEEERIAGEVEEVGKLNTER